MEDVEAWEWHEQHRLGRRIIGDIYVEDAFEPDSDVPEDEDIDFEDDLLGFDPDTAEQQQDEVPVPEWINSAIDVDKLMSDIFRPGTNHVTDGMRGGGKTHQAVAYTEYMVEGRFKGMPRVIMLTNIIFVKRVSFEGDLEDQFVMEDPPGVHHVTSMEQMFRIQTKMMKRYGREGVMFMLVLDEAQNFLLADEYQQDTSIAFIKFYGTTRKFNTCIWLLTPSINNLPPRARNFLDADPAGYVSCQWRKNKQLAAQYIAANHIENADVREFTTMKMGANMAPVWFRITTTPWTRPLEELGIGEYGYDHLANADFKVSIDDNNPFDFKAFMEATSDMPSYRMATVMQEFFDRMDGKSADPDAPPEDDPKAERTAEILRMRELGLTFDQMFYGWIYGKWLMWAELLFIILPVIFLLKKSTRQNPKIFYTMLILTCISITLNRYLLTVQALASPVMPFDSWRTYAPNWAEWGACALVLSYAAMVLSLSYRYLPMFPQEARLNQGE